MEFKFVPSPHLFTTVDNVSNAPKVINTSISMIKNVKTVAALTNSTQSSINVNKTHPNITHPYNHPTSYTMDSRCYITNTKSIRPYKRDQSSVQKRLHITLWATNVSHASNRTNILTCWEEYAHIAHKNQVMYKLIINAKHQLVILLRQKPHCKKV